MPLKECKMNSYFNTFSLCATGLCPEAFRCFRDKVTSRGRDKKPARNFLSLGSHPHGRAAKFASHLVYLRSKSYTYPEMVKEHVY